MSEEQHQLEEGPFDFRRLISHNQTFGQFTNNCKILVLKSTTLNTLHSSTFSLAVLKAYILSVEHLDDNLCKKAQITMEIKCDKVLLNKAQFTMDFNCDKVL